MNYAELASRVSILNDELLLMRQSRNVTPSEAVAVLIDEAISSECESFQTYTVVADEKWELTLQRTGKKSPSEVVNDLREKLEQTERELETLRVDALRFRALSDYLYAWEVEDGAVRFLEEKPPRPPPYDVDEYETKYFASLDQLADWLRQGGGE